MSKPKPKPKRATRAKQITANRLEALALAAVAARAEWVHEHQDHKAIQWTYALPDEANRFLCAAYDRAADGPAYTYSIQGGTSIRRVTLPRKLSVAEALLALRTPDSRSATKP